MIEVPLALNYGMARSSVASGGNLVNLYAQSTPEGAEGSVVLIGVPGTKKVADLRYTTLAGTFPETSVNAMIFAFNKVIAVCDNATYLMDENGTWSHFGTGLPGQVRTAFNRFDVVAVNGERGIWINEGGVDEITGDGWYPANDVAFLDSYFVFNRAGTGQFFQTGSYNRTLNPLDFAEAEKAPDNGLAVLAVGDNLLLFGDQSMEAWYNAGNPVGFAFSRIPGATVEHGIASQTTACQFNGQAFWLSNGGLVMTAGATGGAQRISDDQVEAALKDRGGDWDMSRAFMYADEGHVFYVLTVGNITLAYDMATGYWAQRSNYSRGCIIARCYVQAWGRHFVGDDQGRILEMSSGFYEDAGEPLIAEAVTMPYTNGRNFSAIGQFEVRMDTGLSPMGGEYQVRLAVSGDGVSWSPERPSTIGVSGDREKVVRWGKLGARKKHRVRLRISDPFRRALMAQAWMAVG